MPSSRDHDCTPLPKDGVKYSYEKHHSEHKAGYDIKKFKWKISECPVCNMVHYFDKQDTGIVSFEPYI